jgi:hypothetical protein
MRVSRRTLLICGVAIALLALVFILVSLRVGGDAGVIAASDVGETLVVALAAVALFDCARKLGLSTSLGRPWLLIALGAASFAFGDLIWTILEVGLAQEVPYPGLPDVFYLIEYPLAAIGILSAGRAFKGLVPLRRPAVLAALLGIVLTAGVHLFLLVPAVFAAPDLSLGERILSTLYPLADIWCMVVPAVFVVGVVSMLGGGRLARPWYAVGAGAVLIAASDIGYSWLATYDLYSSGAIIDYGWSLGHVFMMAGALIARDMADPQMPLA